MPAVTEDAKTAATMGITTATVTSPPPELPPRPLLAQNWTRLARMGSLAAGTQIFIALSGMPVTLDSRMIVAPILSLGYLSLLWLPLVVGHRLGHQKELEGVPRHAAGWHEILGGALVGSVSGSGLTVLLLLLARFNLRDPLVNWSPQLAEQLNFDRGTAFGAMVWPVVCAALGAIGGGLWLLRTHHRRLVMITAVATAAASVLELLFSDLLKGIGGEVIVDWLYAKRGGLTPTGAVVLGAVSGTVAALGRKRLDKTRDRLHRLGGTERTRANSYLITGIAVALTVMPLLVGRLTNELLANVGLFVLLALGLNIVVGLTGILDLGYVAFFAVGGYTTAVLTAASSPKFSPELPWFAALLAVIVVAGLTGLFIGAPVIRMRGDYLAIVTLGFGEIIRLLFLSDWLSGWFGGAQGITNIGGVDVFGLATVSGVDPRSVFYLVLAFCALAVYVSWRLEHSRIGRAWMAVREDETVAQVMGVNIVNAKLLAFVVGAILGSFSGAIFAAKVGSVFPTSFMILVSIIILVVVIFGGMGNIVGVIVGAAVLIGVLGGPKQPGLLQEFSQFKLLIYGALLVWMMLSRPQGLIPSVHRTRELHHDEYLQDAWLKGHIDTGEHDSDDGGDQHDSDGRRPTRPGDDDGDQHTGDQHTGDDHESASEALAHTMPATALAHTTPTTALAHTTPATTPAHTTPGKATERAPLLEIRGLSVKFGGINALSDLDLTVHEGEIVALIGPNGAGKTTLFNAVTATIPVTEGDIVFEGQSLLGLDSNHITSRGIARTFQNVRLFANMTVLENVMVSQHCRVPQNIFGTLLCSRTFRREEVKIRERAEQILGFFGTRLVGFRLDQPASTLSYANRRRLEIARAMATQPKLILLDEPVAGMNPVESAELTKLIGELRREWGFAIVMIEHDMKVVSAVSDRVIVLDHGRNLAEGAYSEVVTDPQVVEAYLGRGAAAPALRQTQAHPSQHARHAKAPAS